ATLHPGGQRRSVRRTDQGGELLPGALPGETTSPPLAARMRSRARSRLRRTRTSATTWPLKPACAKGALASSLSVNVRRRSDDARSTVLGSASAVARSAMRGPAPRPRRRSRGHRLGPELLGDVDVERVVDRHDDERRLVARQGLTLVAPEVVDGLTTPGGHAERLGHAHVVGVREVGAEVAAE